MDGYPAATAASPQTLAQAALNIEEGLARCLGTLDVIENGLEGPQPARPELANKTPVGDALLGRFVRTAEKLQRLAGRLERLGGTLGIK